MAGGSGANTCHMCHSDNPLNAPGGSLVVKGLPETYQPGTSYPVTLTVSRPDLRVGGFQLVARFADGRPAGEWKVADDRARVVMGFVQHTEHGAAAPSPGANTWTMEWTAPSSGEVLFNAAANASNDDASALGDYIYTAEARAAGK